MSLSLAQIEPMLLGESKQPFSDPAWTFELKYDGYRILAGIEPGRVRLKSRNGSDATGWFEEVTGGLARLPGRHVLDGEVCVLDSIGRSDFDALQARVRARRWRPGLPHVAYCVFDLLVHDGEDIRALPLSLRKQRLHGLLDPAPPGALLVLDLPADGERLYEAAKALELEGIVAKRLDSPYRSGERTSDWLKLKRPGAIPPERFRR